MASPNTYTLLFTDNDTKWSLSINGVSLATNQTEVTTKPTIVKWFSDNGYGEPMPGQLYYCPTPECYIASFEVFVRIVKTLRK